MSALVGAFRRALRAMVRTPLIQVSAIGAMSIAFLLLGAFVLAALNISELTQSWGRGTHVVVYLKTTNPPERLDKLKRWLRQRPEVAHVDYISSAQAMARLRKGFSQHAGLLDGVGEDILPPSLELRLRDPSALGSDRDTRRLLAAIGGIRGVDEVDHLGNWSQKLGVIAVFVRWGSVALAAAVALACLYIVATTIRLGLFARREELVIQRLVGATEYFVRGPFLVEGALQGLIGAVIASALLYALYAYVSPLLESALSSVVLPVSFSFLRAGYLVCALLGSAAIGIVGSTLALARDREGLT